MFLTRFASKVTILGFGDRLGGSQVLQEKVAEHLSITTRLNTTVAEFKGNGYLSTVVIKDTKTDVVEELHPHGVFMFIGLQPNNKFLETNVQGIFAAGEARAGSTKQVATAALMIRQHLEQS